jgi:hypothetical protein
MFLPAVSFSASTSATLNSRITRVRAWNGFLVRHMQSLGAALR